MDEDAIKKIVTESVCAAIDRKLGEYYIPSERHYHDHMFLESVMEWTNEIKTTALKTIVRSAVTGIMVLLILGFAWWGWNK